MAHLRNGVGEICGGAAEAFAGQIEVDVLLARSLEAADDGAQHLAAFRTAVTIHHPVQIGDRFAADVNVGDVTGKAAVRWRVDGSNPVEEIATTRFLTRSATAAIVNAGAALRGTATAAGARTARCEVSTLIRSHAHFNMLSLSRN